LANRQCAQNVVGRGTKYASRTQSWAGLQTNKSNLNLFKSNQIKANFIQIKSDCKSRFI
jgi:hypothetical protein